MVPPSPISSDPTGNFSDQGIAIAVGWMLPSRRTLTAAMLLLWAGPSASWSAPAASAALRAGKLALWSPRAPPT